MTATELGLFCQLHAYAAVGALVLWCKLGKHGRDVYGLSDFLKLFLNEKWRLRIEPIVFVILGAFLSITFVNPITDAQAVTAGLGWTGLLSKEKKS